MMGLFLVECEREHYCNFKKARKKKVMLCIVIIHWVKARIALYIHLVGVCYKRGQLAIKQYTIIYLNSRTRIIELIDFSKNELMIFIAHLLH